MAGTSKSPKLQLENLDEIKLSLRKEILSDLTKFLAEIQEELLKLIAPTAKKQANPPETIDTDSKPENVPPTITSAPVKSKTTTTTKISPVNSRNSLLQHRNARNV